MSNALIESLLKAGAGTAVVVLLAAVLKTWTERMANHIAERKMLLEVDIEERKEDEERRKAESERREELRKDLADERHRAETEKKRADDLEVALRDKRRLWDMRLLECERVGKPCQVLPVIVLDSSPKPPSG